MECTGLGGVFAEKGGIGITLTLSSLIHTHLISLLCRGQQGYL